MSLLPHCSPVSFRHTPFLHTAWYLVRRRQLALRFRRYAARARSFK